jgi:hypothetical protein
MTSYKNAPGGRIWSDDDVIHREDGPAIEHTNGNKDWYKNGLRHRTDGPAVECANRYTEYWINGTILTPAEFAAKVLNKETALLWKMSRYCWPFDFGLDK